MSTLSQLRKDANQPKREFKIKRFSSKGCLSGIGSGIATFRNYKDYNETLDVYELKADDWNAFRGIRFNFEYDYNYKGEVKDVYTDEFGRKVSVKKVS